MNFFKIEILRMWYLVSREVPYVGGKLLVIITKSRATYLLEQHGRTREMFFRDVELIIFYLPAAAASCREAINDEFVRY